jgi:hypothetical protein
VKSHSDKNAEVEIEKNYKPQNENSDKTNEGKLSNDKEKTQSSVKQNEHLLKYAMYEGKFKKRDGAYFCNFCLKPSDSLNKIIYHLRNYHLTKDDIEKLKCKAVELHNTCKHTCGICHQTFESQGDLSVHSATHTIKTNLRETTTETERNLKLCSSSTTEEVLLDLISRGNFSCHFCKQTLKSMDDIYNHSQKNHEHKLKIANKKIVINCNVCSIKITSMETLGTHIANDHKPQHLKDTTQGTGKQKPCNKEEISNMLSSNDLSISLQVDKKLSRPNLPTVISSTTFPEVKMFYCFICHKLLHSKDAMEYHIKQSHIQYNS